MGERIEIGFLVRFVDVVTSIDTVRPRGTFSIDGRVRKYRLYPERYFDPEPDEIGLVVNGPSRCSAGSNINLWLVLVRGGNWWFTDDHLIVIKNS